MKWIAALALLLVACGQSDAERAQEAAANMTRDPAAAQFRNVRSCDGDGELIYGEMNAKNAFGAYVGFTPFFSDGGTVTIADEHFLSTGEGRKYAAALSERCFGPARSG